MIVVRREAVRLCALGFALLLAPLNIAVPHLPTARWPRGAPQPDGSLAQQHTRKWLAAPDLQLVCDAAAVS